MPGFPVAPRRLSRLAVFLLCALSGLAVSAQPEVTIEKAGAREALQLEFTDQPLRKVLETVARKAGYGAVSLPAQLEAMKTSYKAGGKSAEACLAELLSRHALLIRDSAIGKDMTLTLTSGKPWRCQHRAIHGTIVSIWQLPTGAKLPAPDRWGCFSRLHRGPRADGELLSLRITDQKDAKGQPIRLIDYRIWQGRVMLATSRKFDPWPGLSSFKVKGEIRRAGKQTRVVVGKLAASNKPQPLGKEGQPLDLRLDRVKVARGVAVWVSWPSTSTDRAVFQGGWGRPVAPQLAEVTGRKIELCTADGKPLQIMMGSCEGKNGRMVATVGVMDRVLKAAGGIANLRLVVTIPEGGAQKQAFELPFSYE